MLLSEAVLGDPQVRELLAERGLRSSSFVTELKGLDDAFQLHALDLSA